VRRRSTTAPVQRDFRQPPTVALIADPILDREPHVVEEHLVERVGGRHVDDRRHGQTGQIGRADEVRHAAMFRNVGIGAGDQNAELRVVPARRPDLRPVDDVLVAITHRPRSEVGEVGARVGLAEHLTPDFLARQNLRDIAFLLLRRARVEDRRRGPTDTDLILWQFDVGGLQLFVDDQLMHRIGGQPVRLREVRGDVARFGQLLSGRVRVSGQPVAHRHSTRIIIGNGFEVHSATLMASLHPEKRPHAYRVVAPGRTSAPISAMWSRSARSRICR